MCVYIFWNLEGLIITRRRFRANRAVFFGVESSSSSLKRANVDEDVVVVKPIITDAAMKLDWMNSFSYFFIASPRMHRSYLRLFSLLLDVITTSTDWNCSSFPFYPRHTAAAMTKNFSSFYYGQAAEKVFGFFPTWRIDTVLLLSVYRRKRKDRRTCVG